MSQISVPSSLQTFLYPAGFQIADTDVLSYVGGSDLVNCVSNPSDLVYAHDVGSIAPPTSTDSFLNAIYQFQPLTDPSVDVDHVLRIVLRYSSTSVNVTLQGENVSSFSLFVGATLGTSTFITTGTVDTPASGSFAELTFTLTPEEVQTFRGAGGYALGPWLLLQLDLSNSVITSDDADTTLDLSYLQFSCPGTGPDPDIEVTSDAGLILDGTDDAEWINGPILTSSAGLLLDSAVGSGGISFNSIIGNAGLRFNSSAAGIMANAITGDAGLEFNGSFQVISSVDVSGIYLIIPGQTHDTLYARETLVSTVDVAIPNPFFETAKIGY